MHRVLPYSCVRDLNENRRSVFGKAVERLQFNWSRTTTHPFGIPRYKRAKGLRRLKLSRDGEKVLGRAVY